jgi:hypothetical protein
LCPCPCGVRVLVFCCCFCFVLFVSASGAISYWGFGTGPLGNTDGRGARRGKSGSNKTTTPRREATSVHKKEERHKDIYKMHAQWLRKCAWRGAIWRWVYWAGPPENTDVSPDRGGQNRKTKTRRYDTIIVDLLAHPPRTPKC